LLSVLSLTLKTAAIFSWGIPNAAIIWIFLRSLSLGSQHGRPGFPAIAIVGNKLCTKLENGKSMPQAIAYYRVSTARQGKSGLGIEAQKAAVKRFAAAEGFDLVSEHFEVETGKGADALVLQLGFILKFLHCCGALGSAQVPMSNPRRQARSAISRRAFHQRADGPQGAVHRR
jgi:Resolvase, N terminal domain